MYWTHNLCQDWSVSDVVDDSGGLLNRFVQGTIYDIMDLGPTRMDKTHFDHILVPMDRNAAMYTETYKNIF